MYASSIEEGVARAEAVPELSSFANAADNDLEEAPPTTPIGERPAATVAPKPLTGPPPPMPAPRPLTSAPPAPHSPNTPPATRPSENLAGPATVVDPVASTRRGARAAAAVRGASARRPCERAPRPRRARHGRRRRDAGGGRTLARTVARARREEGRPRDARLVGHSTDDHEADRGVRRKRHAACVDDGPQASFARPQRRHGRRRRWPSAALAELVGRRAARRVGPWRGAVAVASAGACVADHDADARADRRRAARRPRARAHAGAADGAVQRAAHGAPSDRPCAARTGCVVRASCVARPGATPLRRAGRASRWGPAVGRSAAAIARSASAVGRRAAWRGARRAASERSPTRARRSRPTGRRALPDKPQTQAGPRSKAAASAAHSRKKPPRAPILDPWSEEAAPSRAVPSAQPRDRDVVVRSRRDDAEVISRAS